MQNPFKTVRVGISTIFLNQHLQTICLWKVFFPMFLILVIYPVYALLLKVDHPFQRAFSQGDLLIFSALIMVEAAIELKRAQSRYDDLLQFIAMATMVVFGFVKYGAMLREPHLHVGNLNGLSIEASIALAQAAQEAAVELRAFSFFNCAVAACAVAISLYTFLHIVRRENLTANEELELGSE